MDEAAIIGEYVTFKHVKTRKVVILEVEVPEELFQDVITKLGMPIGGESKPVAVALLDAGHLKNSRTFEKAQDKQTDGEKLRTRAVLICKNIEFQKFCWDSGALYESGFSNMQLASDSAEKEAKEYLYSYCGINSRSELATDRHAQDCFNILLAEFDAWKVSQQYADNLSR